MGLYKSKLPQMGRPLRPQEKGNIAGVAGLLGGGKETRGQERGADTSLSGAYTPPRHDCTSSRSSSH